jgi:hypothetical protein
MKFPEIQFELWDYFLHIFMKQANTKEHTAIRNAIYKNPCYLTGLVYLRIILEMYIFSFGYTLLSNMFISF